MGLAGAADLHASRGMLGCWDVVSHSVRSAEDCAAEHWQGGQKNMEPYKEAWVLANCGKSVGESKMYETGGNMLWLNPEVWCEKFIPGPEPPWA